MRTAHHWIEPEAGEDARPTKFSQLMSGPKAHEELLRKVSGIMWDTRPRVSSSCAAEGGGATFSSFLGDLKAHERLH